MLKKLNELSPVLGAGLAALLMSSPASSEQPSTSGVVSRFLAEDALITAFYDPEKDLTYVLGIDIVASCSGTPPADAVADLSVQEVLVDDQPGGLLDRIVYRDEGEGYAGIWQGDALGGDVCANVLGTPPVAEGTVNYRYTDNDINWIFDCAINDTPNDNANAWGLMWNGVLEDYFGQPAPFSGQFRAVWQQCDESTFNERLHVQF